MATSRSAKNKQRGKGSTKARTAKNVAVKATAKKLMQRRGAKKATTKTTRPKPAGASPAAAVRGGESTLTGLLKREIDQAYRAAEVLFKLVDNDKLGWRPATGTNWLTVGQLLLHCSRACGWCCNNFLTNEWRDDSIDIEDQTDGMMPTADDYKSVGSVQEALDLLADDKRIALDAIASVGETRLAGERISAPWGTEATLGQQFLGMITHLNVHRAQLFYYLKLQGQPVNTAHLWGMV